MVFFFEKPWIISLRWRHLGGPGRWGPCASLPLESLDPGRLPSVAGAWLCCPCGQVQVRQVTAGVPQASLLRPTGSGLNAACHPLA